MEPAMKDALKSMLDNAYDNLKKYTQGLYEAQSKAVEAKTAYELAKAAKIVSGAIQGKNESERKAAEATVLAMEIVDPDTWNLNPLVGSTPIVLPSRSSVAAVRYPVFHRAVGDPRL